jgi:hypothetical protein
MTMMKAFATIICWSKRIMGIDPDKPLYENFDDTLFNLAKQKPGGRSVSENHCKYADQINYPYYCFWILYPGRRN